MHIETEKIEKLSWFQISQGVDTNVCCNLLKRLRDLGFGFADMIPATLAPAYPSTNNLENYLLPDGLIRADKKGVEININKMPRHFFKTTKFKGEPL